MNEAFKQSVTDTFEFACTTMEVDREQWDSNRFKGSLALYGISSELFKVHNHLALDEPGLAAYVLTDTMSEIFECIRNQKLEWHLENEDSMRDTARMVKQAKDNAALWLYTEYTTILERYSLSPLLYGRILDPENGAEPEVLLSARKALEGSLTNLFCYRQGTAELIGVEKAGFAMATDIQMTTSLAPLLSYLSKQDAEDETVRVNVVMKIEERVDLSYFIVTFCWKDWVWLLTDQTEFENPRNKATTRKPGRHREGHYNNLMFPYGLIDDLEKLKQTTVAPAGTSFTIHPFPMKDLDVPCLLFLVALAENTIAKLPGELRMISTLGEHTKTLIGPAKRSSNEGLLYWTKEAKQAYKEAMDTAPEHVGLVHISKDLVKSHDLYDPDWLATPESLAKLTNWMAKDAEAQKGVEAMRSVAERKTEDSMWLMKRLREPGMHQRVMPWAFSGDVVFTLLNKQKDTFSTHMKVAPSHFIIDNPKNKPTRSGTWFQDVGNLSIGEYWNKNRTDHKPTCELCGRFKSVAQKIIIVRHFKTLALVLGVEVKELPPYWRAYRTHDCVPYKGNSILDNTHPFLRIEPPSWREHSNGINITLHLCGKCSMAAKKEHFVSAKTLVTDEGKVVEWNGADPQWANYVINVN